MNKFKELQEELTLVFSGKGGGIIDAIIPLISFIILRRFMELKMAAFLTMAAAGSVILFRLLKKQSLVFALGGAGTTALAAFLAYLSGTASGYFLPGIISGGFLVLGCAISVLFKRPLAAFSSKLTRGWPLDWYWHELVRPAYSEVTLLWGILFGVRFVVELYLFTQNANNALGNVRILMGWPYTLLTLFLSYIYGQKRLANLKGPGVEEFTNDVQPPWVGQNKGF